MCKTVDESNARPDVGCTELLAEAIAILRECEETWGCECPYCDRDFGKDWDSHADDCRLKKFLITANAAPHSERAIECRRGLDFNGGKL